MDTNSELLYDEEKRHERRVHYDLKLYYPRINNESVYIKYKFDAPILETIDISESGISFISRVELKEGDFISFLLAVGINPSFWCISEVKWVEKINICYKLGCQFYCLTASQIDIIREYVNKKLM